MSSHLTKQIFFIIIGLILIVLIIPVLTHQNWSEWLTDIVQTDYENEVDDDDDDISLSEMEEDEALLISLDEERIALSGVKVFQVAQRQFIPEKKAHAAVIDIRSLIQWRARLNQLKAEVALANVNASAARQELNRLKKISAGVASKNINYADAAWQQAQAQLQSAQYQLETAELELLQEWGESIAAWITTKSSQEFQQLVHRQESLLLVTLPLDTTLPADVSVIRVGQSGNRSGARKAYFISTAYISDKQIQGETYYFRTPTGKLRLGMRLDAWIPENGEPLTGVFIPEKAIVWYAGEPWTYVQTEPYTFQRVALTSGLSAAGGIFMTSVIHAEDEIVISGSQMLLSEEFRWQIQEEDDDDD